jgi:ParB family chromosome partitioning protein
LLGAADFEALFTEAPRKNMLQNIHTRTWVEDLLFTSEGHEAKTTMPLELIVLPQEELRYYINPDEVEKIVASARKNGIIEPLLVRPQSSTDKYEVVAGAKRYRAAQILGLYEVPVVIRKLDDFEALEIALVENFARSGLTDLEETDGVLKLLSMKLTIPFTEVPPLLHRIQNQQRERLVSTNNIIGEETIRLVQDVLTSLGNIKLDSFISNRLPLLNLPDDILLVLRQGKLETSKAKAIGKVEDEETRRQLIEEAIVNHLSLSEIKKKIKELTITVHGASSGSKLSLKERADETFDKLKKSKVWDDPKKKAKVEKLLVQLEALL